MVDDNGQPTGKMIQRVTQKLGIDSKWASLTSGWKDLDEMRNIAWSK